MPDAGTMNVSFARPGSHAQSARNQRMQGKTTDVVCASLRPEEPCGDAPRVQRTVPGIRAESEPYVSVRFPLYESFPLDHCHGHVGVGIDDCNARCAFAPDQFHPRGGISDQSCVVFLAVGAPGPRHTSTESSCMASCSEAGERERFRSGTNAPHTARPFFGLRSPNSSSNRFSDSVLRVVVGGNGTPGHGNQPPYQIEMEGVAGMPRQSRGRVAWHGPPPREES